MTESTDDVVEFVIDDHETATSNLLRELQRAVFLHPEAARASFNAFVAEGRSFAQTADGAIWKERILRSTLLERGTLVWDSVTQWIADDANECATPSALIDAVAAAAMSPNRDPLIDALFRRLDAEGH